MALRLRGVSGTVAPQSATPGPPPIVPSATTYAAEPLGAGGWVTGISISADGATRLARTDTLGAWRWDTGTDQWVASVAADTMPAGYRELDTGVGVQAVVAADDVAFLGYKDSIFRSTDGGRTWTLSSLNTAVTAPNSGEQRWWNTRMAVDPANQDRCLYGTLQNGLLYTTDGGATWVTATGVPNGTAAFGIPCVAIDPAGNWYAAPHGSGVYRSTDHGATWTKISSDAQFVVVSGMAAGPNGDVMVAAHTSTTLTSANSVVYRYRGGVWANVTPSLGGRTWRPVAYDPTQPGNVMVQGDGGYERRSNDYGDTWVESWNNFTAAADDVPWLAAATGNNIRYFYRTLGGLQFDPVVSGRVWMSQGIGVWYADLATDQLADVHWVAQSRGIEQLVVNDVMAPPGGATVAVSWDRPVFLVGETTSAPIAAIAPPANIPVGYGGSLIGALVRGYPLPITHAWSVVSAPGGSAGGTFGSPTALSTAFVPDVTGTYVLRLTSTNAAGSHATDVTVTAVAAIRGLVLPGTAGNFLQTPDDASLDITGSLTLLFHGSLATWTPTTRTTLIGKWLTGTSYDMSVDSTGLQIRLASTGNGSAGAFSNILTPLTFPPGSAQWIRLIYDAAAHLVTVETSNDGTTWTPYVSTSTSIGLPGTTPLNVSTSPVTVGAGAGTGFITGKVYRAQVYSGATLVANFDATAVTRTGTRLPASATDSVGKVWTPQGTGWDWTA